MLVESILMMFLVEAAPTEQQVITRFDRQSAFSKSFSISQFPAVDAPPTISKITKVDQPAFIFKFQCDQSIPAKNCELAKQGFQNAGARIAKVLNIKETIVVNAVYHSLCKANNYMNCANLNRTLGQASASSYFPARVVGKSDYLYYPQALVKQLQKKETLTYAPSDIFAEFNSDFPFYFKDSGLPINRNDTDFEFVVTHEMTHGLAFDSELVHFANFYQSLNLATSSKYLAPLPFSQGSGQASAIVTSTSPISAYDSFIRQGSNNFLDLGRRMTQFNGKKMTVAEYVKAFENSGDPMTAATAAYKMAVSSQLKFITSSNLEIPLNSPDSFAPGTSVVHVDPSLANTKDFLMIPAVEGLVGQKLDDIIQKAGGSEVYGPGIIAMMQTLGWPTKDTSAVASIEIGKSTASSALGVHTRLAVLMLAAWLFM
ncbi:hypothetical protein BC833DRAFT_561589 [Globomyces pollinis-pini]|nr:hypothetical protein BC833DRAFT_561589 [Globomyces pollinis-pini]KAJ3000157.1 hypothetical protein HDV02_000440 [Globomyces sp. JEL0801]